MLSFMEQSQIYNSINFSIGGPGGASNANQTAWSTKIATFLCPSDSNAGTALSDNGSGLANMNNYCASYGTTSISYNTTSTGLFSYSATYGIRDTTDGSSNTIAYGEVLVGDSSNTPGKRSNGIMGVGGVVGYNDVNQTVTSNNPWASSLLTGDLAACSTAYLSGVGGSNLHNSTGAMWLIGTLGDSMFNTVVPPSSSQYKWGACKQGGGGWAEGMSYSNASSLHSGGANFLFADGSVKFIKSSISMQTYWAIGTRGNGEVISSDSF